MSPSNSQAWESVQGSSYAKARAPYPPALYPLLQAYLSSTGAHFDLAVDLGCGPGTVTKYLSPLFKTVHGVDISKAMYDGAPTLPNVTYHTLPAHSLTFLSDESVDLITAGTAAHWFDHDKFWTEMQRVVRPGGSVAVWTFGPGYIPLEPKTLPPQLIELLLTRLYLGPLAPYRSPGNQMTFSLYDTLPLPSLSTAPSFLASDVGGEGWRRKWGWEAGRGYLEATCGKEGWEALKWDVREDKGILVEQEEVEDEMAKGMSIEMTLDEFEAYIDSVSPVIRYRASNPEKDFIKCQLKNVKALPSWSGESVLKLRRVMGLVVWKKSSVK